MIQEEGPDPYEYGSMDEYLEAQRNHEMRTNPQGVTAAEEKLLKAVRRGKATKEQPEKR